MTKTPNQRPAADDLIGQRKMVGQFASSLDDLHEQALRLGMPFVAHFLGVAALAASEDEYATPPHSCARSEETQGKVRRGSQMPIPGIRFSDWLHRKAHS